MASNILVSLLLLLYCGLIYAQPPQVADGNGRIVGGHKTTIDKYPYQVSIRLDTYTLLHICGGSIYAPRVIVTAAHCIKGRFASTIRIVAGATSIVDQSEVGLRVTKLIPHKGYNRKTHENDVGLIILAEKLVYSSVIQPIALASENVPPGVHGTVTGWGKNHEESQTLTNTLQEVDVEIVGRAPCSTTYLSKSLDITEQMICAGVEGKDACQGDSGGPLVVNGKLVGIVSWGIGCARSGFPGVYAKVAYHKQWIEHNAQPYM